MQAPGVCIADQAGLTVTRRMLLRLYAAAPVLAFTFPHVSGHYCLNLREDAHGCSKTFSAQCLVRGGVEP